MRTVWKYPLQSHGAPQSLQLPMGAEILLVQNQHDQITLWAEVDSELETETLWFILTPTGGEVPANAEYLDTIIGLVLVLHAWELEGQE